MTTATKCHSVKAKFRAGGTDTDGFLLSTVKCPRSPKPPSPGLLWLKQDRQGGRTRGLDAASWEKAEPWECVRLSPGVSFLRNGKTINPKVDQKIERLIKRKNR